MRRFALFFSFLCCMALLPSVALAGENGLEKSLQDSLLQSRKLLVAIGQRLAVGESIQGEIDRLRKEAEHIRRMQPKLDERFLARRYKLDTVGPKARARHNDMVRRYQSAVADYLDLVESLPPDSAVVPPATLDALRQLLDSILPKREPPLLGTLPYRHLNYPARPPTAAPTILPAYMGGDGTVRPEDTAASPEAPLTEAIASLAESLEWNPVRIYEWVKNNIETQWYWGCMKGAEETLRQKSGNDADQAALLAALFRASGYPTRYVRGVIEFFPDIEQARHLTGIADARELGVFLQKAGIPYTPVIAGGKVANYQVEHIWVESRIPLANYRGAILDEHGKEWIALDTSIKVAGYSLNAPASGAEAISFSAIREQYLASSHAELPDEYLFAAVDAYLEANNPGTTFQDLLLSRSLIPEELGLLPGSLQFVQVAVSGEYDSLPDVLKHRVRFVAAGVENPEAMFDLTLDALALAGKSIAVTYEPETVEDQETINAYGGLGNTPSYLVHLRPVLTVEGKRLAVGQSGLAPGDTYGFVVELLSPNGVERVHNVNVTGNLSVIGLACQQVVMPENIPPAEKNAERLLHEQALGYIDRWNKAEEEYASFLQLGFSRPIPSVVTLGGVLDVTYLLDTPHAVSWKGLYLDADLRAIETVGGVDLADGSEPGVVFLQHSALQGSALESRTFEDAFGIDSISTAKLFGLVNEQQRPILTIDNGNIDTLLPTLDMPDNVREDIKNSVNQGLSVRIPAQDFSHQNWTGTGYIKENLLTGEAGYMLSGLIAGGMTALGPEFWPDYFDPAVFKNPFSKPPNDNPAEARFIKIIQASDLQQGTVGKVLPTPLQVIVLDENNLPVRGAQVRFSVKAGGGKLSNGGPVMSMSTDYNGIAEVEFTLGQKTEANPAMWWENGYTYSQQVGENIVEASLASGIRTATPFTAFGFPGAPVKITKTSGDNKQRSILGWAGFVAVVIEDAYGNPISNLPVNFSVGAVSEKSTCPNPNQDTRPTLVFSESDSCLNGIPAYGECGTASIEEITSNQGTHAQVMLGGIPDADYTIAVSSLGLQTSFTLSTRAFGNCEGEELPDLRPGLSTKHLADVFGNNITAGPLGATVPLVAQLKCLAEGETKEPIDYGCNSGTVTCDTIVGDRTYDSVLPDTSSMTFGGQPGSPGANGEFSVMFNLGDAPGKKTVDINGRGMKTLRYTADVCDKCETATYDYPFNIQTTMVVYAVDIATEQEFFVPVDKDGYTTCDTNLDYEILPSDYLASTAYTVISKNGTPLLFLPTEQQGKGFGALAQGYRFDLDATYTAQVFLNYGSEFYEIPSKEIPLVLEELRIDSVYLEDHKTSVPPGDQGVLRAVTYPAGRVVNWKIIQRDPGVLAEINQTSGVVIADKKTKTGWITVRVTDAEVPCVFEIVRVRIGCEECDTGQCAVPGNGVILISSIDANFSLGAGKFGQSAGNIFLKADEPSAILATPQALTFTTLTRDGVEVRRDESGILRQVLTPQSFIDIVATSEFSYELRYFKPQDIQGESNGLYTVASGAVPFVSWRVENPDASPDVYNRLQITEIKGDTNTYEYAWDEQQQTWSLSKGNGEVVESRAESFDATTLNKTITETLRNAAGEVASVVESIYHAYPWGEELIGTVVDPLGAALTTSIEYYDNPDEPGSYKKIKSRINADGSWFRYSYDADGRKVGEVGSWLDAPSDAPADAAREITYDYASVDPADSRDARDAEQPRTVTESILGNVVSKTFYAYMVDSQGIRTEIVEQAATSAASYGDPENQRTVTIFYASGTGLPESGKVRNVSYPDGRLDSRAYGTGAYDPAGMTFIPGAGEYVLEVVTHGTEAQPDGIAFKSTRETTVRNELGRTLFTETSAYTGSGYERVQWTANSLDEFGRIVEVRQSNGTLVETVWGCCAKDSETDAQGVRRNYSYDALKRLVAEEVQGLNGPIVTRYTYDAAGNRLTKTTSGGTLSLTSTSTYDPAGRLQQTIDPAGLVTAYAYEAGGLTTTVIQPGGATETTTKYPDGRIQSITGTRVVPQYYEYGVNPDGSRWTTVHTGGPASPRWEKTTEDMLGRTILVEKPGFGGTVEVTQSFYNEKGQLERLAISGMADQLYTYDELGNQVATGLDMDANSLLEEAATDRITASATSFVLLAGDWWQESVQMVYATVNDATPTVVGRGRDRLTGLGAGNLTRESVRIDIHGNETVARAFTDRANKTVTRVIDLPDSTLDATNTTVAGLLTESRDKAGITITYGYDDLGRRTGTTDPRTGVTTIQYNSLGQVDSVEDAAGNRTGYEYDPQTGRRIVEINAQGKATRYGYDVQGRVTHTWGAASYPVQYVYDGYGQRVEMRTFRQGTGWDADTWPVANDALDDLTTWVYDEATGLLTAKKDAAGKVVSYTYAVGGKLASRTWARDNGAVLTDYDYDPASGELILIDYLDTTPDVTFVYDRVGRQETITDASGSRTFAYNSSLQLETETVSGLYNKTITRNYDALGRNSGFTTGAEYTAAYGFDPDTGRFASVSWDIGGVTGNTTYSYVPDSNLPYRVTYDSGQVATYGYEPHRNLKTQVKNEFNSNLISQYDYSYDAGGRREHVRNSGSAFGANAFNLYGYNDRNELIASNRYLGADATDTTQPVDSENRGYAYDNIGNRKEAATWDDANAVRMRLTYTANQLNQYDLITTDTGRPDEAPAYDDDGNMTGYGGKLYTYNAENRLVAVEPQLPADNDTSVEFIYDYMGRRIKKTVYAYSSSTQSWELNAQSLFVYDGWNLIAELDAAAVTQAAYVWGLDLSQSLQGAGGIGGLLARVEGGAGYTYTYDANGNVGQLLDSAGAVSAHYEYDPYGNPIVASGAYATVNPFRFSTKYHDNETTLYYYGYRYYSPELGRWLNRDPIGENGGINTYGFVLNDIVNRYDVLGRYYPYDYNDPSLTDPVGYYDYGDLLVGGQAQQQINSFQDALSHFRSGAGGVVSAGPGLYAEMRSDGSFRERVAGNKSWVAERIKERLENVPKNKTKGTFSSAPGSFVGQLSSKTLGSYGLNIRYTLVWNAGPWESRWHSFLSGSCYREVSTITTVNFNNVTDWNFKWNKDYGWFKNITREVIPGWIAGARGNPAGFNISLHLSETYTLRVEQDL